MVMHGRLAGATTPPSTRHRVIFVTYYYSPYVSGLTLCTRAVAEGLARRGWDVHVVCGRHRPDTRDREVIGGVTVHRLATLGGLDKGVLVPWMVPTVLRLAGRRGLIIPVLPLVEAALLSRLHPRMRVVPYYICDLRLGQGAVGRIIERLAHSSARTTVARAPVYAALSEEYARASRIIGDLGRRVIEVPPPVHPDGFVPSDPSRLASRLGLEPGDRLVGFVGRLVPEKGLPVLLDAASLLRQTHPDVRVVIAGEGDSVAGGGLGAELRGRTRGDPSVMFTGFIPKADLPAFYSMLDVLALPSTDPLEAYGMVQVEAMLCGTPVVASDMPGVRIPIARTGMGKLAVPGDASSLAASLRAVLDDPGTYSVTRDVLLRKIDPDEGIGSMDAALKMITLRES